VHQAIALFNAAQHEEAMFLVKELADACPNVDILGCRVVEVSVMRSCYVIHADLCNSHIRHTYAFSSESMHSMMRVTTKRLTTLLLLCTQALSHRNIFI
jgi:hypothetical protein